MRELKVLRLLFAMASLLLVVKPFLGFAAINSLSHQPVSNTILVKSFAKRKPESLNEGNAKAEAIHQQLSNPQVLLVSAISLLLVALLPAIIERLRKLTGQLISDIRTALLPREQTYLLTGKLTI